MNGKLRKDITQQELKEAVTYNKDTGEFTRNKSAGAAKKGSICKSPTAHGYIRICIKGIDYMAHRLAFLYMEGALPDVDVDHINHITSDNRWCNLRLVSKSLNQRNRTLSKNNKSGSNGVYFSNSHNRWVAVAYINNKRKHIGNFKTKEEAIEARNLFNANNEFHINHGDIK